jgi:hypothetical protein
LFISVNEDVCLDSGEEYIIPGVANAEEDRSENYFFEAAKEKMLERGLLVANAVVKGNSKNVPIRIINVSEESVKLYKHTKLGILEQVEVMEASNTYVRNIKIASGSNDCAQHHMKCMYDKIDKIPTLSVEEKNRAKSLLTGYSDIFSISKNDFGLCKALKHEIALKDTTPIQQYARRVPVGLEEKVEEMIGVWETKGVIRPSMSPWSSPLVVIKKKNGDIRICVDFRRLNAATLRPIYHIPDTQQILDSLSGSTLFSTIDLSSAYYQCEVKEEHKYLTSFITRRGQYEFNRMPFGLCGAPFTFQRLMNVVLRKENWEKCLIYLDDVIIFARDFEEHVAKLKCILQRLREAGLKLTPEKCNFFQQELTFLGHVVSNEGIKTDPEKIRAIHDWGKPATVEDMRGFLGFANYYRRFVKEYASLTCVLETLMKKSANGNINNNKKYQLQWDSNADSAFTLLKKKLMSAPVLAYPNDRDVFILDMDASHE